MHRLRLLEYLDHQYDRPLTLVSAPAGYGKSVLISCWMEMCDIPNAWLSLDEIDSDLRQFLTYFLAAVQTLFPDTMGETAIHGLDNLLRDYHLPHDARKTRLVVTYVFIHMVSGDLTEAEVANRQLADDPMLSALMGASEARLAIAQGRLEPKILPLLAMAREKQGKAEEALTILEWAVTLAQPGGFIFPFVELGAPMADLLKRLFEQNVASDYIEKLLAAFPDTGARPPLPDLRSTNNERGFESETVAQIQNPKSTRLSSSQAQIPNSLIEPLTHRELDVLELLAQRLQNKEIADKLFVAPETVKAHLHNIYQKLSIGKRREAVEKAKKIGIL